MTRTHASKYIQFEEKVKVGSTLGKKKTDPKPSSSAVNSSNVDCNSSRSDMFSSSPGNKRWTLRRRIVDPHAQLKQYLINTLNKIDCAATTADYWSTHSKSYLGMAVHWIDRVTRVRKHAVLAFMRIKGDHSYDVLSQAMINIHYEYHIEKQVTRTTTDNGSNFVKMFVQFGTEGDLLSDMTSTSHNVNSDTDDDVAAFLTESDIE
ncbi:Putative AC transposase [Eumeta japonica]|uniref:AC transposase n=1 Tax=Eumeta variegata TaxID=151549 RepID=A0A4C1USU1_EUMVA|nr:Putative AC transposase [Eumeta japonica]